ncbi:hypothetical protein FRB95_007527 [Tulasnella sp. JGI-2019a]|nr:hypothetical protein FRB95_007527 [Tulasnella sp. JGI-2019a]
MLVLLLAFLTPLIAVQSQSTWTSCPLYCFPRNAQTSAELKALGCPPFSSIANASGTYYTPTCTCYDYQTLDAAQFTNCYTCANITTELTFQNTCAPAQTAPTAPSSCSSQSDAISQACSDKSNIDQVVSYICDADEGLSSSAKSVFSSIKFLSKGLAQAALSMVDAGCKSYSESQKSAGEIIDTGCDLWTNIGESLR